VEVEKIMDKLKVRWPFGIAGIILLFVCFGPYSIEGGFMEIHVSYNPLTMCTTDIIETNLFGKMKSREKNCGISWGKYIKHKWKSQEWMIEE